MPYESSIHSISKNAGESNPKWRFYEKSSSIWNSFKLHYTKKNNKAFLQTIMPRIFVLQYTKNICFKTKSPRQGLRDTAHSQILLFFFLRRFFANELHILHNFKIRIWMHENTPSNASVIGTLSNDTLATILRLSRPLQLTSPRSEFTFLRKRHAPNTCFIK